MKKIGIIIGMLLILAAMPATAWAGTYSGGSGTSGDPYQIGDLDDLLELSTTSGDWGAYFEQTANIDASATSGWNGGDGFSPIGDSSTQFTGSYDGQGHTIDGLTINRSSTYDIGFFGYTDGAEISNLGLVNVDVTGQSRVGGLAGYNTSSTISDCYVTGNVTSDYSSASSIGGLVGYNTDSTVTNCRTEGTVTADGNAAWAIGGLVGLNYGGCTVQHSFSTCDVTSGAQQAGGFVGRNGYSGNATISDCYATGEVTGEGYYSGGFVGVNSSGFSVVNCYSTGTVGGTGSYLGGFSGQNGGNITDSFWDTETSGTEDSWGGTGKTTAEMKTQSTFTDAGWDFTDTWEMNEDVTYPLLRGLEGQPPIPEWPMIALFSAGVLALAAFVVYKKRRAITVAA